MARFNPNLRRKLLKVPGKVFAIRQFRHQVELGFFGVEDEFSVRYMILLVHPLPIGVGTRSKPNRKLGRSSIPRKTYLSSKYITVIAVAALIPVHQRRSRGGALLEQKRSPLRTSDVMPYLRFPILLWKCIA